MKYHSKREHEFPGQHVYMEKRLKIDFQRCRTKILCPHKNVFQGRK